MDDARFDRLTRLCATARSRRTAIGGLLAGAAALLGLAIPEEAGAACRGLNRSCRKTRFGRPRCCRGLVCRRDRCRPKECPSFPRRSQDRDRGCCQGEVVNLRSNREHCGRCGRSCHGNPCIDGRCVNPCREGQRYCHGACVNVLTNPNHCGGCNRRCFPNNFCEGGRCTACRQRGESCRSAGQCCYDVTPAPIADPEEFNNAIHCEPWPPFQGAAWQKDCPQPPPGDYCCTQTGAACSDDCDCCWGLRCYDQHGCLGHRVEDGMPCPTSCPPDGPCDKCMSDECVDGICRIQVPMCKPYGEPCSTLVPCCNQVPCSGGLCRYP